MTHGSEKLTSNQEIFVSYQIEISIRNETSSALGNSSSPTPQEGCRPQRMEAGGGSADASPGFVQVLVERREGQEADVESTKETRMPTQVTPDAEKSTLEHVA